MSTAIERQLIDYTQTGDFAAFTALINSLSQRKLAAFDPVTYATILDNLAHYPAYSDPITPEMIADATRALMARADAYVPASIISKAIDDFVQWSEIFNNYTALDAVTDYLTVQQKGSLDLNTIGQAFSDLTSDWDVPATVIQDFMRKLDHQVPIQVISQAIERLAAQGSAKDDFTSLKAATDFLTPQQKAALDPSSLGHALLDISYYQGFTTAGSVNPAARDFMSKFGALIPINMLSQAIVSFAGLGMALDNFGTLDTVTDHLSAQQKLALDPLQLASALLNMQFISPPQFVDISSVTTAAVHDFMSKFAALIPSDILSQTIETLVQQGITYGNFVVLEAATDRLSAQQKQALDPNILGQSLIDIATSPNLAWFTAHEISSVVRDFMSKFGGLLSPQMLGQIIVDYSMFSNGQMDYTALDAVTDYVTPQQKAALDPVLLGQALLYMDYYGGAPYPQTAVGAAVGDFMKKFGALIPPQMLSQAIQWFAQQGLYTGVSAIVKSLTADQLPQLDSALLGQALPNLVFSGPPLDIAVVLREFMSKLDIYIPPLAISQAIATATAGGNFLALDAVTDFLTTAQKAALEPGYIGAALVDIANHGPILGADATTAAAEDLMAKLGAYMPAFALGQAAASFAAQNNLSGVDAIFNHISAAQYGLISPTYIASITALGITLGSGSVDTFTGTAADDKIFGLGGNDIISGGAGNDSLYGDQGNDVLTGGTGDDFVNGGLGHDTYNFARGDGADIASDNGGSDILSLGAGISRDQLWFQQSGNNLVVSVVGTTDKVTVANWFSSTASHIEQIKTADGHVLVDTKVQNLVNAMAGLAVPSTTMLSTAYHTQLDPVIAANWT